MGRTIPVSADRCCDWKKTASISLHFGHCLLDRGSCRMSITSAVVSKIFTSTSIVYLYTSCFLRDIGMPILQDVTAYCPVITAIYLGKDSSTALLLINNAKELLSQDVEVPKLERPTVGSAPTSWVTPAVSPTVL